MDAARLVAEAERAMRASPQPEDVIAEAWQAYELTEAVGRVLTAERGERGEPEERGEAGEFGEYGESAEHGRAVIRAGPAAMGTLAVAGASAGPGPPRAARLTGVRDSAGTLRALRTLLGEIGHALVVITCTAEDEAAYWLCIEALDAVDEAKDRVRSLARADPG